MNKWDTYFMDVSLAVSMLSKDKSTQLGAVIVGPDKEIRATGYNSFPRGVNDNVPARQERPLKYQWFEHAERNAIYNAARCGTSLKGCVIYCAWPPCTDCARGIIQAGIVEVVVRSLNCVSRWADDMRVALEMLEEAGVKIRVVEVQPCAE